MLGIFFYKPFKAFDLTLHTNSAFYINYKRNTCTRLIETAFFINGI